VLLKQALREMEEELTRDEQRRDQWQRELALLCTRQTDLDRSLPAIDEELGICFAAGKDDLARGSIRRKLEIQRTITLLANKRDALDTSLATLKTQIEERRASLIALRQKAEVLAECAAGSETVEPWRYPEVLVRDEDVEVAFLREKHQRSGS
jgi:phage shock protein A